MGLLLHWMPMTPLSDDKEPLRQQLTAKMQTNEAKAIYKHHKVTSDFRWCAQPTTWKKLPDPLPGEWSVQNLSQQAWNLCNKGKPGQKPPIIAQFRPQEAVLIDLWRCFWLPERCKNEFGQNCTDVILVNNFVDFRAVFSNSLLEVSICLTMSAPIIRVLSCKFGRIR